MLLFFLFLLSGAAVVAQDHYFTHYKVENGLSNNSVFCSLQDNRGFVWLGTKDGLNRFDGHSFTVFRNDPEEPYSLGSNFILSLCQDSAGVLWVGSNNGLYRYDAEHERFALLKGTEDAIRAIEADRQGAVWFIAGLDLHQYIPTQKALRVFPSSQFFSATALCTTPGGVVWTATEDGLVKKWDGRRFTSYNVFGHSPPAASRWIEKIYAPDDSTLFIGTSNQGVKILHTGTGTYRDVLTYNSDRTAIFVRDFIKAGEQEYWIATESGIFVYDRTTGGATNLRKGFGDPYALPDNAVYTLCQDREGGIWAGTFFGGVAYYPAQHNLFQKTYPTIDPHSLRGTAVREICQDRYGHTWIGTEDAGLNKLNPATGRFTHYQPGGAHSLAYSNIHGLLAWDNELWIGTFEHGLDVMDIPSGRIIRHYDADSGPGSLHSNFIHDLHRTAAGVLLIATARGLYRYHRERDYFTLLPQFPAGQFYTKILEDSQGTLWVGSYRNGLYYFNPRTGDRGHFLHEPGNGASLNGNRVNDLYEDSEGRLWVATENGFCRLLTPEKGFTRYTTRNGMPSNMVYGILEDDRKNLWLSTSKGLCRFHPASGNMTVYSKVNGLLSDQFNYNSAYKDGEGRLYFGNTGGYISFQPARFTPNTFVPPVYITGFRLNSSDGPPPGNGSPLKDAISFTRGITLEHHQSSFSIDFAALSYTAPSMTEYAYRMEGLDGDWTYLKTNRRVYFTDLKPGLYTFRIKAAVFDGDWSGETKLVIQVLPPFWATTPARIFYLVLLAAAVVYAVRRYHRVAEEKKQKEIYQAKIDFFTNVAHEIRTPLTLIKGPVDNLQELVDELPDAREDLATLQRNTRRLVDLVTQILDFRQTEAGGFSIEFTRVNISGLLTETYESFRLLARQRALEYHLYLPPTDVHTLADEEALTKVLSNLFSNAVKYAGHEVAIRLLPVQKGDTSLILEVRNDGYLIPPDMKEKIFEPFFRLREASREKGTGIGLSLARSLVELHKGQLYLQDSRDGSNTFVLCLPLAVSGRVEKTPEALINS